MKLFHLILGRMAAALIDTYLMGRTVLSGRDGRSQ